MNIAIIIALFVIGFILVGVELFVTPGFVVGLVGMAFMAVANYVIFQNYGETAGTVAVIITSAILLTFFILGLRSGFWNRIASKEQITGKANRMDQPPVGLGDEGRTLSALRPSGTALFGEERLEVQSDGAFVDSGKRVVVTKIVENKLYVTLIE